ncbi:MAG TPA: FAD-dependent oxidoreductase [Dissulfurispiraceae bacterium]|nr:FAD-dependent oxidoreductase [Dissulfurispiraceae bacterium]
MKYIIIGNGVAGTSAAITIRKQDTAADILILSAEPTPFYSRIRLIDYLAGEVSEQELILFKNSWYEKNAITLRLSSPAERIDPKTKTVQIAGEQTLRYDRLLLATGGVPTLPPIEGIRLPCVYTLRTLADAERIRDAAGRSQNVLVLGGGLLGIETANALQKAGNTVTVVEYFPRLLPRQMDAAGGEVLQRALEHLGLQFVLDAKTRAVIDDAGRRGIELLDGRFVAADMVIVSAGIAPNRALLDGLPVEPGRGVPVNDLLETGIPDIYAAGDLVEHRGVMYGIWSAAERQGKVAGMNMAGERELYTGTLPSSVLKVAGIDLMSAGNIDADSKYRSVVETDADKGIYRKLVLDGDTLVGCILCGSTEGKKDILTAIQEKKPLQSIADAIGRKE